MSFCLDTYLQQSDNYEIHASKAGFKDCAMIIRFKADDLVYIKPGDEVLGVRVIGIPPIPPIDEEEVEKIRKLDTGNKK